jgi:hypothetical protein
MKPETAVIVFHAAWCLAFFATFLIPWSRRRHSGTRLRLIEDRRPGQDRRPRTVA